VSLGMYTKRGQGSGSLKWSFGALRLKVGPPQFR
jgi:hypothetical protein